VSEIWASQEQFNEFSERLMPLIEQAGIEGSEPEILEVHNQVRS
jgi:hypothetical protein